MKLNEKIINQSKENYNKLIKEFKEKILNLELYKNFQLGKVYKLTDKNNKISYILYCCPNFEQGGAIRAYPLNKNFELYKSKCKYDQNYFLSYYTEIEEISDNLKREIFEKYISISDGKEIVKIYYE